MTARQAGLGAALVRRNIIRRTQNTHTHGTNSVGGDVDHGRASDRLPIAARGAARQRLCRARW